MQRLVADISAASITRVLLNADSKITGGAPLLALFEKGPSNGRHRSASLCAAAESAPSRAFIGTDFSSHSTMTTITDIPLAISENEDRIGRVRSIRLLESERPVSMLSA